MIPDYSEYSIYDVDENDLTTPASVFDKTKTTLRIEATANETFANLFNDKYNDENDFMDQQEPE